MFLARGEPPFSLALGNPAVKAANLSLSTLIPITVRNVWPDWVRPRRAERQ
ncbi:DUF3999 family protein [Pseudomonas sp. PCH446]